MLLMNHNECGQHHICEQKAERDILMLCYEFNIFGYAANALWEFTNKITFRDSY